MNTLFVVVCSFQWSCAKKTISSNKERQRHAHDFHPDDPKLAGGASSQINEHDESGNEINVVLKNMSVQEIHTSV